MMKPHVVRSINDDSGDRCVDILRAGTEFSFVECRRDPEDSHGWRHLYPPRGPYRSENEARENAGRAIEWLEASK